MTSSSDTLAVGMIFLILPVGLCCLGSSGARNHRRSDRSAAYFEYANGRTSTDERQALAALRPHASASFRSATFSTQKPSKCSLASVYGPSVTSSSPLGWTRTDLALLAEESPPTKILTPAATISSLSTSMSRFIASVSTDGS